MWKFCSKIDLINLLNNDFLVHFNLWEKIVQALTWGAGGHGWCEVTIFISISGLQSSFVSNIIFTMTIRAQFLEPTIHLYYPKSLREIGEVVGRDIKVNDQVSNYACGQFARMAMEIDLSKPLVVDFALG